MISRTERVYTFTIMLYGRTFVLVFHSENEVETAVRRVWMELWIMGKFNTAQGLYNNRKPNVDAGHAPVETYIQ